MCRYITAFKRSTNFLFVKCALTYSTQALALSAFVVHMLGDHFYTTYFFLVNDRIAATSFPYLLYIAPTNPQHMLDALA